VYAAGSGAVVFAGELAGRPVISIAHPGGLRTSYEPVPDPVRPGQLVAAGAALGELVAGHPGCAVACLHWGCDVGPAPTPTTSIRSGCWPPPIRLKPLHGLDFLRGQTQNRTIGAAIMRVCVWSPVRG
jgi:murein DD-endopeptidase MepM/ murein hydrolase activator NlpD